MKFRRISEFPTGPAAVAAALLMFLAVGVDSVHLAAHARPDQTADAAEICAGTGEGIHSRETHIHRGPPPRQVICVACLWHGMGKTPPPAAEPAAPATETSPAPAVPVASAGSFDGLTALARAPPSA